MQQETVISWSVEQSDNLTQGPASGGMESRRRGKEGERNGSAVGGTERTPESREEAKSEPRFIACDWWVEVGGS